MYFFANFNLFILFDGSGVNWKWTDKDMQTVVPVLVTLIGFCLYWFVAQSDTIKSHFYRDHPFDQASSSHIFFTKCFGLIAMGVLPAIVCLILLPKFSLSDYGIRIVAETTLQSVYWIIGIAVLVVPLGIISARQDKNHINYPQVRAGAWTNKILFKSLFGWVLYLFGYEFLFRGILLIPLVDSIGMWPAIAINIALYSGTHIPKGLGETIGAIPLGLVLSLITIVTGTIWVALFVHITLAWTNNLASLRFNPDTNYINRPRG